MADVGAGVVKACRERLGQNNTLTFFIDLSLPFFFFLRSFYFFNIFFKSLFVLNPTPQTTPSSWVLWNKHQKSFFFGHPYFAFPAYNQFPRNVFITHNHLDHAGELPLLFEFESKRRRSAGERRLRVLSGPEVQQKLKTYRLDEMLSLYTPVSHKSLLHFIEFDANKVICTKGVKFIKLNILCDFFLGWEKIKGELLPCKLSKWFCVKCFMLKSFISVRVATRCLLQNQSRTGNITYRPQWYLSKSKV